MRAGPRDRRRRRGRRLQPRLVAGCRHAGEAGLPPPGAPSGVPGCPSPVPTSVSSPPRDLGGVRARVCPHVRESLAADGRLPPIGGHGRSSRRDPDLAVRASARSPTPHARPRSAATRRPRACSSEPSLCHGRDGDPGGDRRSRLLATPSTGTARKRRARPAPAGPGRMAGGASAPCRKLGIEPTDLSLLGGKDSVPT